MTPLLIRSQLLFLSIFSLAVVASAQSQSPLYRISTLNPLASDPATASASEWSLDFSTADPSSGAVLAKVFAPDFQRWAYPQPMPALPFRTDTSARIDGLESLMLFHHQPKLGGEVFRFAENTNTSTFYYPAPQLPAGFSHVMYDERMDLFLGLACDLIDAGSNTWNVSLWTIDDDQYEQTISIWSTQLVALPGTGGADGSMLSIVGYNDAMSLLSFYFPTASDGGSITTLSVAASLNWQIVATVVGVMPWSLQRTKHAESAADAAAKHAESAAAEDQERARAERTIDALNARKNPFPALRRSMPSATPAAAPPTLLGFASTRQSASDSAPQGLIGFASADGLGFIEVNSGATGSFDFDFSSFIAPRLSWHRTAQELLVIEWTAPWRYVRCNATDLINTGTLQFEGGDEGQTLLGIYPLDG